MRRSLLLRLIPLWSVALSVVACVDPLELDLPGTVDVVVVDGTINNLAEPQRIRLNRSKADPTTGRFGTLPLTNATVDVVVDSAEAIRCRETEAGDYQLPVGFRGQVGHAYQLRIQLADGSRYVSDQQVMPAVPLIEQVRAAFNPTSLPGKLYAGQRAAHDISIDTQDPARIRNYYRWDSEVYERQDWCRSCYQGVYAVYKILPKTYLYGSYFVSGTELYEDCFVPTYDPSPEAPKVNRMPWWYDYECRTACWEIIRNYNLELFDDGVSDGGRIANRRVAQAPFLQHTGALVRIRQSSLTAGAYQYYKLFQQQTQNTGGLADTPPTALVGNVRNVANRQENVIGYFTASAVSVANLWLDRKDASGTPPGLFQALNGDREPTPEPYPPYTGERASPFVLIWGGPPRVPTAVCVPSDTRTPFKPEGWRN